MNKIILSLFSTALLLGGSQSVEAQQNAADSVMNHAKGNRLSVGGYGDMER